MMADAANAASPDGEDDAAAPPTPVTVITGFLGSGKSTLLAHVLHERHGHRIAVIQNELASGNSLAEQVSLISETGERFDEWVELPNGCLCCSVRDKLTVALEALMERRGQFDHILIETTGVADPGALASTFWLDDALESRLMLDGIVTLVDAANVLRHVSASAPLAAPNEVVQQIAYADHILLNKARRAARPCRARVASLGGAWLVARGDASTPRRTDRPARTRAATPPALSIARAALCAPLRRLTWRRPRRTWRRWSARSAGSTRSRPSSAPITPMSTSRASSARARSKRRARSR
jgi:hypothetical protein